MTLKPIRTNDDTPKGSLVLVSGSEAFSEVAKKIDKEIEYFFVEVAKSLELMAFANGDLTICFERVGDLYTKFSLNSVLDEIVDVEASSFFSEDETIINLANKLDDTASKLRAVVNERARRRELRLSGR